ncbi:hypothetical protein VKT23_019057 [Stygiomarasmius scandens]|uniref:BTB domain-containing protein n=1 Tax=Marasmiellus scandens TaxID=2682957 RepID=A0ABR1IQ92_9AGAR
MAVFGFSYPPQSLTSSSTAASTPRAQTPDSVKSDGVVIEPIRPPSVRDEPRIVPSPPSLVPTPFADFAPPLPLEDEVRGRSRSRSPSVASTRVKAPPPQPPVPVSWVCGVSPGPIHVPSWYHRSRTPPIVIQQPSSSSQPRSTIVAVPHAEDQPVPPAVPGSSSLRVPSPPTAIFVPPIARMPPAPIAYTSSSSSSDSRSRSRSRADRRRLRSRSRSSSRSRSRTPVIIRVPSTVTSSNYGYTANRPNQVPGNDPIPVPMPPPPPQYIYPPAPVRHNRQNTRQSSRYFFEDGSDVIQVQDVIYRIHKHVLGASPTLGAEMRQWTWDYGMNFNLTDRCKSDEFDLLLSVFYPSDFTQYEAQSVADWTSILRLASEFQMKNVRVLAMKQLFPIASAAEKIDLANKYDIKDWLVPAYMELCARTEELTLEEGKKLGVEAVMGVAQLRSQLLANVKTFVEKL